MSRRTSPGTRRRARAGTVAAGVIAIGAMTLVVAPGLSTVSGAADPTITPIVIDDSLDLAPIVSDDGSLVLLSSTLPLDPDAPAPPEGEVLEPATVVRLHDRTDATTTDLPDAGAVFAALSGSGCTVAYAVPVADPAADPDDDPDAAAGDGGEAIDDPPVDDPAGADPGVEAPVADGVAADDDAEGEVVPQQFEIRVVDRCETDVLVSTAITTTALVAPLALDQAGLTLVANTGDDVVRFTRSAATDTEPATTFAEAQRFDLDPVATAESLTLGPVDVNDDGTVIVYAAAAVVPADAVDPAPAIPSVVVWESEIVTPLLLDASNPAVSGDGRIVAADVADVVDAALSGVTILERPADGTEPRRVLIDAAGDLPSISADGNHLFYVVADGDTAGARRASWTGESELAFNDVTVTDLGVPIDGEERLGIPVGALSASRHGDVIASDDPASADVLVRTAPPSVAFGAQQYDLGSGIVGSTLAGTATLTNTGDSTIDLDTAVIAVGSPFTVAAVADGACAGAFRPGDVCTLDLEYVVAAPIDTVADLTLTLDGAEQALATASVSAVGTPDTTTTTSTTTTTTAAPVVTTPSTTPNTTRTTTQNTTRPTTRVTVRATTTTTTTLPIVPTFSPSTFEFAPTIVDAGRRVASLAIGNSATTPIEVTTVVVQPPDAGFVITGGSTCPNATIASGQNCRVDVEFAPTLEGPLTATLVATFADGRTASASISGFGAPTPVVGVVPGVASTGQVVTLRGSGFPAGAVVEVSISSEAMPRSVTLSDVGAFDLPVVILPNTLPGPVTMTVVGQVDLFPAVSSSLLVTATSDRTSPGVLRGPGPNIGR